MMAEVLNLETSERFQAPETLFEANRIMGLEMDGIADSTYSAVPKCNDPDLREELFANVVLAGKSTMFPGMKERLQKDLSELVERDHLMVDIEVPADRNFSAWMGRLLLAYLPSFQSMWITREEYNESGTSIVNRKCWT
jgi:actin